MFPNLKSYKRLKGISSDIFRFATQIRVNQDSMHVKTEENLSRKRGLFY